MLESLTIKNYAIIDEMTVEFSDGLNVITGETGAGKSIVVDAFELVLGARAISEMVRSGAETMSVSGVFAIKENFLREEIPYETDDGLLILRRDVRSDGGSRCFVNNVPVTLKSLKKLGDRLVDLHGQHDHQSLLDVSEHVRYLDGYGRLSDLARKVEDLFNEMVRIRREINYLESSMQQFNRDRELYQFQIKEIEEIKIAHGEDVSLINDIRRLSRAAELKALGWEIFQELSEAEGSIGERFGVIQSKIESLSRYDSKLSAFIERFEDLSVRLTDAANAMREYAEKINDDLATLAEMEERLALIERIKKKYGPDIDDVFRYLEEIQKKIGGVENSEAKIAELKFRREEIESRLTDCAFKLSEDRKKVAPGLSREVETHLSQLGMSGSRLVIVIDKYEGTDELVIDGKTIPVGKDGFDSIEFLFSANPGEPPKSLVKVASGGEVSRVMLSLKLVLIETARVPTMVFDEIDIGVSGRVAEAVGKKILQLSEARQVLAITHLPQIAVMAKRHFSARKSVREGRTYTDLVLLNERARQEELAALLSGETMTDTALAHAKKLMEKVERNKS